MRGNVEKQKANGRLIALGCIRRAGRLPFAFFCLLLDLALSMTFYSWVLPAHVSLPSQPFPNDIGKSLNSTVPEDEHLEADSSDGWFEDVDADEKMRQNLSY